MHRTSVSLMMASLAAMMKGVAAEPIRTAEGAPMGIGDIQNELGKMGVPRYGHRKSHAAFLHQESRRPSESYKERQKMRRRWENGLPVPDDVRAAYERHAAERADIARRRAFYDQHPSVRAA